MQEMVRSLKNRINLEKIRKNKKNILDFMIDIESLMINSNKWRIKLLLFDFIQKYVCFLYFF